MSRPEPSPAGSVFPGSGRFVPGAVLAQRYRIVALLGRGGMGEVYRADDLTLGQPVALKFLPELLERDAGRLARFRNEVRLARQISHANVCRVYDIGEAEGRHFLSMEYVDGEDLAALLRRIGRLPHDKALDVARQLCMGLAAAHERGIQHRDLKPANVMIDGRGKVRITDFGLAAAAQEVLSPEEASAGTPSYMAPEQLSGKEATIRSDLYSLGLVLYEVFTGKPAFAARTVEELARIRSERTPDRLSSRIEGIDPAVERVVLRCLEPDPRDRPASAFAVAAALPGGDPLRAALEAGETPSPEMVANAGEVGGMGALRATLCLGMVVLGLLAIVLVSGQAWITGLIPLPKSPDVLRERAGQITRDLGYPEPGKDATYGFDYQSTYFSKGSPADLWPWVSKGQPSPIRFWYRESPDYLVRNDFQVREAYDNPPLKTPGMIGAVLDPSGRLLEFQAAPPERDSLGQTVPEQGWAPLFVAAGLDSTRFVSVPSIWTPSQYADRRAAWTGSYPDAPEIPIRVEAASYRGQFVSFRILDPWTQPARSSAAHAFTPADSINVIIEILSLIGAAILARRNIRLGRSDLRGALRLGFYLFSLRLLTWVVQNHHVPHPIEEVTLRASLAWSLFAFGSVWIYYVALEPYVRRLWPELLVSWVRLIKGRVRDPLVGRDALIGTLIGILLVTLQLGYILVPQWLGHGPPRPDIFGDPVASMIVMKSPLYAIGQTFSIQRFTVLNVLGFVVSLLVVRLLLRRNALAIGAMILLFTIFLQRSSGNTQVDLAFSFVFVSTFVLLLFRYGVLSAMFALASHDVLTTFPITADLSSWYSGYSLFAVLLVLGIALYGFVVARAGRPLFGRMAEI